RCFGHRLFLRAVGRFRRSVEHHRPPQTATAEDGAAIRHRDADQSNTRLAQSYERNIDSVVQSDRLYIRCRILVARRTVIPGSICRGGNVEGQAPAVAAQPWLERMG